MGYLTELGVDGFMIAPAYGYEAVREGDPAGAERIFLTRPEVHEKFRLARRLLGKYRLFASPLYLEFLCGQRELPCAAWANPTRNVRGWRAPCYLIADGHCRSYRGVAGDDRLGAARAGPRSALRRLPDALRLRAGRRVGRQSPLARRPEDGGLADGMKAMTSAPCPFGVVFALGIEARALESLLANADHHAAARDSTSGRADSTTAAS